MNLYDYARPVVDTRRLRGRPVPYEDGDWSQTGGAGGQPAVSAGDRARSLATYAKNDPEAAAKMRPASAFAQGQRDGQDEADYAAGRGQRIGAIVPRGTSTGGGQPSQSGAVPLGPSRPIDVNAYNGSRYDPNFAQNNGGRSLTDIEGAPAPTPAFSSTFSQGQRAPAAVPLPAMAAQSPTYDYAHPSSMVGPDGQRSFIQPGGDLTAQPPVAPVGGPDDEGAEAGPDDETDEQPTAPAPQAQSLRRAPLAAGVTESQVRAARDPASKMTDFVNGMGAAPKIPYVPHGFHDTTPAVPAGSTLPAARPQVQLPGSPRLPAISANLYQRKKKPASGPNFQATFFAGNRRSPAYA